MAARGTIPKSDGAFNSVAVGLNLYVRNKITANSLCSAGVITNELYVVGGDATVQGLKVSGDATFCGDVNISGQTTVNNIFVCGNATIQGDFYVSGNTTLNGDLYVSGDTSLDGDLQVGGTVTLHSDLFVSGNTTLNGDLLVKGNTTLNSNLYVSGNTTLNNLFVENSTTLDDLRVLGNTTLNGDLLVQGDTTLQGHLFVGSGATVHGNFKVSGNTSLCGDVDVSGNTDFAGDVNIQGDLSVQGNTTLYSDLFVKGDTTLSSLLVSGNSTLTGDLQVEGSVSLVNGLYVSGDTTLNGDLRVLGNTTLSGDLIVKGNTTLAENLYVSGGTTIQGNLKVQGDASLCSNLVVGLNTTMDGRLKVQGDASLCSDVQVGQNLQVDGNTVVDGTLTVQGNTILNQQLYVEGHVTLNDTLKVSGSATFCNHVRVVGGDLRTDDICVEPGFTLYTNDIHPKTGTVVTVGGPGDSIMVDRVNTRYIDGKFGGSITISTSVNVLGDLSATGIICSTLPFSIVETNILRSKDTSTTLTLGTAGAPKVVCIAQGNTLMVENIVGKDGVGGLGLEICATTLQVEDIIPKAPNKSVTIGVSTTLNVNGNLNVIGTVFGNQFSPRTGGGLTLGGGGHLVQVRDNMCVDGYIQSGSMRAKENANTFLLERINGADRVTLDISNPSFKIIAAQGISLCAKNNRVDVDGDIYANNFFASGGGAAMIMANQVVTDTITTKNGDVLELENMAGTPQMHLDYTSVAGPLIDARTGALRLTSTGTSEIRLENPTQTRRLEPDTNNTRNAGTASLRYANVFANTVNARTVTGPTGAGLTINADNGEILLNRVGAGDITLAAVGANRDIVIQPTGASLIVTSDVCVSGTLAVSNIIGKNGGAVNTFCATTIQTDDIQSKTGNIIDFQNMAAANIVRVNVGPASGPLISSQSGQPLRFSGSGNGISLEDTTTTNNVVPDQTGLRDIGTTALRYNEVFANIGDFSTRVDTPLLRNNAGNLGIHASTGVVNLTRTGAGDLLINGGGNHIVIDNGANGISLVTGLVDLDQDLCVRGTLQTNNVTSKTGTKTTTFGSLTNAFTGDLHCFDGSIQTNLIESKAIEDMFVIQRNSGAQFNLNLRVGTNSNVIAGNNSNTIAKVGNSTRCGIFMGNNHNITNGADHSVIIGGANHRINGADYSVVVGGTSTSMSASRGVVLGGTGNIVGGSRNCAMSSQNSAVYGNRNAVVGGAQHIISPNLLSTGVTNSFIGGGISCSINNGVLYSSVIGSRFSKIGTGTTNRTFGGGIFGGRNIIVRSNNSSVAGGSTITVDDTIGTGGRCFVGGGINHHINARDSAIIAGQANRVRGTNDVVVGGIGNSITQGSTVNVIVGGADSTIKGTALRNAIMASQGSLVKGQTSNSAIVGGLNCSIAHDVNVVTNSVIVGGRDSTISASQSMIIGRDAMITQANQIFVNADPTRKLQNGAALNMQVPLDGLGHLALQSQGDIYVFSDIDMTLRSVNNTSDAKQKMDIEPLPFGLQEVLKMEPKEFYFRQENYKVLGEPKMLGFIAQEMEAIDKSLVVRESNKKKKYAYRNRVAKLEDKTPLPEEMYDTNTPDEEERFSLNYMSFIPILTKAIKEQHTLITSLQDRVAQLEQFHV